MPIKLEILGEGIAQAWLTIMHVWKGYGYASQIQKYCSFVGGYEFCSIQRIHAPH
jgi:hypothetical protein